MYSFKPYYVVLWVILLFVRDVISLSPLEYQCTLNFFNRTLNVSQNFKIDPNTLLYDFCDGSLKPTDALVICDGQSVNLIRTTQTTNKLITPSDIQCFSSINTLNIDTFKVSKNFLLGPFSQSLSTVSLHNGNSSIFDIDIGIGKSIPIPNLNIKLYLSGPLNIYFSSLLMVNNLYLITQTLQPKYKINYINDLVGISKSFENIFTYTHFIPSMNNILVNLLQLTLLPGTNLSSFSSFSTYGNVTSFSLSPSNSAVYPFPIALASIPTCKNKNTGFSLNYQIDTPVGFIDLSNYNETVDVTISLPNAGNLFNVNGQFPFSALPKKLNILEFQNGNFAQFNFDQFLNKNSKIIKLGDNNMGGVFPTSFPTNFLSKDVSLYVNDNQLTGQIDESWCEIDLDISNNLISGQAPSCVVCHYLQPFTNSIFGGNQFTNLNENCTTIELNLSYDNETKSLLLYGKDLGFSANSFTLDNPRNWATSLVTTNKEFQIKKNLFATGPIAKGFNITFPYLPQGPRTFEITAYNQFSPEINSVTENSGVFTIIGKYFAYNCNVINVLISDEICFVSSCNFNQIQCSLNSLTQTNSDSSYDSSNSSTIIVSVMDVSSTFVFSLNQNL